jgi:hypothetical protein
VTAGALVIELHTQEGDTNLMLDGWTKLSDEKGYPKTEEGLRRYLTRIKDGKIKLPTRKGANKITSATTPPPEEFIQWWKEHSEGKEDGPQARVAFNCQRYRDEWKQSNSASASAAMEPHGAPF